MARWTLALTLILLLLSPTPTAASCLPMSRAEQEARADAIVDGTVVDITTVGSRSEVTLRVAQVLKGSVGETIVLRIRPPGQISSVDVPFHEGWPHWRLYLREDPVGSGQLATTICDGTHEIAPPTPAQPEATLGPTEPTESQAAPEAIQPAEPSHDCRLNQEPAD